MLKSLYLSCSFVDRVLPTFSRDFFMLMPEVNLLYLLLQLEPILLLLGQLLIKGGVLILKRFYLSFDLGPHLNLVIASFSQVKFRLVSFTFQVFIF